MAMIDICPACGYPTVGVELCAYCVPVQSTNGHHPFHSIPGAGQARFCPARPLTILGHPNPSLAESNQALQAG